MASKLRIKVNPTFEETIDLVLENYLNQYISWKFTIFKLNSLTTQRHCSFTSNTKEGIRYLCAMIWRTVCEDCDYDAIKWLDKFAKSWLVRDDAPIFVDCTCSQEE
jgi:hypothetical protein